MPFRFTLRVIVRTLLLTAALLIVATACGSNASEAPAEPTPLSVEGDVPFIPVQPVADEPAATLPSIGVLAPVEENAGVLEEETEATPEPADVDETEETSEVEGTPEAEETPDATETPEDGEIEVTEVPTTTTVTEPLVTVAPLPTRAPVRVPPVVALPTQAPPQVVSTSALTILDDETPAPPLTVIVSMNSKFEGYRFRISGLVRNDAAEPYAGLGMNATFFRDDGSRFGPIKVNVQCPVLEPGESCPFLLEAIDKGITQVMLHPDGHPTERRTVPVETRSVSSYRDTLGYVHITGSVFNPNPVAVRDVTVTGALIDDRGEIVSTGVALLLQTIEAGASASFDVLIRHAPYTRTQLFVQALPKP